MPSRVARALRSGFPRQAVVLLLAAAVLGGCALLDFRGQARRERLLDEGYAAIRKGDCETGYYKLKEIQVAHPGSAEAREAFPKATFCMKRKYMYDRHRNPDSVWLGTEKEFVFEWFADFLDDEALAARRARNVFLGMPWSYYRSFEKYSRDNPTFSHWEILVEEDNGRIEKVAVKRIETAAP